MFTFFSMIAFILMVLFIGSVISLLAGVIYDMCVCPYTPLSQHRPFSFSLQTLEADSWLQAFCEQYSIDIYRSRDGYYEVRYSEPDELLIVESLMHPERPIPLKWKAFLVDTDGTPVSAWPNQLSEEQRLAYLFSRKV